MLRLALLAPVLGATLKGHIELGNELDIPATSFVLRDMVSLQRRRQLVTANGSFEFYNLQKDVNYILTLDSDTLELPWSYLVTAKAETEDDFDIHKIYEGRPIDSLGASVNHPLEVTGSKRAELVVDRPNFSLWKFVTQPMVLLSLGALLLVTYLPSLLQNMDPELLEELQKNQIQPGRAFDTKKNHELATRIVERKAKKE